MAYRRAIHDHRHPHSEDDSYGDHQDRDAHRNVGNRMIHRFLLNHSLLTQAAGIRRHNPLLASGRSSDPTDSSGPPGGCEAAPAITPLSARGLLKLLANRIRDQWSAHTTTDCPIAL